MSESLIAVALGNSRIKLCAFVAGRPEAAAAVPVGDAAALTAALQAAHQALHAFPEAPCVVASVNPARTQAVIRQCEDTAPERPVLEIGDEVAVPIGLQVDRGYTPGADRLLNAAAAFDTLKSACVVVDAGTALTVDYVDGAGTFHGGAILPGVRLMLKALQTGTAQLPEVVWQAPAEALGHSTAEAIRSGVFHGLRGAVRELVEQYAQSTGAFPLVVVTGGDAPLLFGGWEMVDREVPDLTLLGVRLAFQVAAGGGLSPDQPPLRPPAAALGDDDAEEGEE